MRFQLTVAPLKHFASPQKRGKEPDVNASFRRAVVKSCYNCVTEAEDGIPPLWPGSPGLWPPRAIMLHGMTLALSIAVLRQEIDAGRGCYRFPDLHEPRGSIWSWCLMIQQADFRWSSALSRRSTVCKRTGSPMPCCSSASVAACNNFSHLPNVVIWGSGPILGQIRLGINAHDAPEYAARSVRNNKPMEVTCDQAYAL